MAVSSLLPPAQSGVHPWERFARTDPLHYIVTAFDGDMDRFWASGAEEAATILADVQPYLYRRGTVTEIGCGAGRCLLPISASFERAVGVDVSPTMLSLMRRFALEQGRADAITPYAPEQPWAEQQADLIFSTRVFRHIDSPRVIYGYISGIARALAPDGVAHLQFNTRPSTLSYRVRHQLPDPVLPKHWRRGARGVRLSRSTVLEMLVRQRLHVLHETQPHSDYNVFVVVKG